MLILFLKWVFRITLFQIYTAKWPDLTVNCALYPYDNDDKLKILWHNAYIKYNQWHGNQKGGGLKVIRWNKTHEILKVQMSQQK